MIVEFVNPQEALGKPGGRYARGGERLPNDAADRQADGRTMPVAWLERLSSAGMVPSGNAIAPARAAATVNCARGAILDRLEKILREATRR